MKIICQQDISVTIDFQQGGTTKYTLGIDDSDSDLFKIHSHTSLEGASDFKIDGSSQTEKWVGGTAPSAGGGSGVDCYTFNILKTANATFTVMANQVNFA